MRPSDADPYDQKEMNRDANDVNKGLDARKFLQAVGVALALLLVVALIFVAVARKRELSHARVTKPTTAASPQ